MKKLILLAALFLSAIAFAQTEKDLIGKWEFVSVEKYTGEPDERELMESLLDGYSVQLNEDHIGAVTIMDRPMIGKWTYDAVKKKVELKTGDGKIKDFTVIGATKSELRIQQNEDLAIKMKKIDADAIELPSVPATKPATKEQVAGKWQLSGIEFNGQTAPMKDAFMKFEANGNYSDLIMGMKGEGKWEILTEEGVHYLVTTTKGSPKRYYILDISDSLLRMATPGKEGVFVFAKTKA